MISRARELGWRPLGPRRVSSPFSARIPTNALPVLDGSCPRIPFPKTLFGHLRPNSIIPAPEADGPSRRSLAPHRHSPEVVQGSCWLCYADADPLFGFRSQAHGHDLVGVGRRLAALD